MPSKAQRAATRKGAAFLLNFGFGFETRDLFQRKANASADMMSGKLAAFAPASDCYWVNLPALCELLWGKKGIELGSSCFMATPNIHMDALMTTVDACLRKRLVRSSIAWQLLTLGG
jgi:hypothetical protein